MLIKEQHNEELINRGNIALSTSTLGKFGSVSEKHNSMNKLYSFDIIGK
jgi:hypothetical protein